MEDAVTIFGRVKPPNAGKETKLVLESHVYIISAFRAVSILGSVDQPNVGKEVKLGLGLGSVKF